MKVRAQSRSVLLSENPSLTGPDLLLPVTPSTLGMHLECALEVPFHDGLGVLQFFLLFQLVYPDFKSKPAAGDSVDASSGSSPSTCP
jgi:hypothetical protein